MTMGPYNHDLAIKIITESDPHQEHPDSSDTLEAISRTVFDRRCEAGRSGDTAIKDPEE